MCDDQSVEVAPSALGTKEFWDARYELELNNFNDCGDEGEVWFGRSAENRILKFLDAVSASRDLAILDLGCGNGSLLRRLRERGFTSLVGVDYCPSAVELSRKAAGQDESSVNIDFQVMDVLAPLDGSLNGQYAFVLDKGTWDAMSLCSPDERAVRRDSYRETVLKALEHAGRLVIVSCNFTKDELIALFASPSLVFDCEIPAQTSFSFGGKAGVTSSGVVFKKY